MEKRYSLLIMGCISIAIISISIIVSFYMPYNGEETSVTIESAKQLKISASEIGVEEIKASYISEPADIFKRVGERTNQSFVFEMGSKLEECGAIDVNRLQLYVKPREPMLLAGYVADFYVFNNTTGAKEFFDYMKEEMNGSSVSVSGLGDEAAYSEQMSGWLVRTSNSVLLVGFVGVGGEFDGKDASRIIAEKIVEKVSHK